MAHAALFSLYLPLLIISSAAPGTSRAQGPGLGGKQAPVQGALLTAMAWLHGLWAPGGRPGVQWARVRIVDGGRWGEGVPWFLMRAWRHAHRASLVPGLGFGSGRIAPSSTALLSPASVFPFYFCAFGVGVVFSTFNMPFHGTSRISITTGIYWKITWYQI